MATVISQSNLSAGESLNITTISVNNTWYSPHRAAANTYIRSYTEAQSLQASRNGQRLVISAVNLSSSVKRLIEVLGAILEPPEYYADLEATLIEIQGTTIPFILTLSACNLIKPGSPSERKLLRKVDCMWMVLDNFATARELMSRKMLDPQLNWPRNVALLLTIAWHAVWWIFCEGRLIKRITRTLDEQRQATDSTLAQILVPSFCSLVSSRQTQFFDFFGAQWSLPEDLCLNRDVFQAVLRLKYKGGPAEPFVVMGQFSVFIQGETTGVGMSAWKDAITSGNNLQLSVVINWRKPGEVQVRCPHCAYCFSQANLVKEWIDCVQCGCTFNARPTEAGSDGIYSTSTPEVNHMSNDKSAQVHAFKVFSIRITPDDHLADTSTTGAFDFFAQDDVATSLQNRDTTIGQLIKSLKSDPSDPHNWHLLGRAYMADQNYLRAYEAYQQAVYRNGHNPTFWSSIGVMYFGVDQYSDALDAFVRSIQLDPDHQETWAQLGSLYGANGQIEDAIDAYTRAVEAEPSNTTNIQQLQRLQETQGTQRLQVMSELPFSDSYESGNAYSDNIL